MSEFCNSWSSANNSSILVLDWSFSAKIFFFMFLICRFVCLMKFISRRVLLIGVLHNGHFFVTISPCFKDACKCESKARDSIVCWQSSKSTNLQKIYKSWSRVTIFVLSGAEANLFSKNYKPSFRIHTLFLKSSF